MTFANIGTAGGASVSDSVEQSCERFIALLRQVSSLAPDTAEMLRQSCREARRVCGKTDLVLNGVSSENVHILLGGWACRTRSLHDGRRQITALLLSGNICDLDNLYIDPPDETVFTLTECEIAFVPKARLKAFMRRDAGFAESMGWFAAVDKLVLGARLANIGQRPARERIAHLLCELVTRLKARGEVHGDTCHVPLTQEQLGEMLGLTTVHVNRVLQGLRAANIVARQGSQLTILDWEALQAIGSYSPNYPHVAAGAPNRPRR